MITWAILKGLLLGSLALSSTLKDTVNMSQTEKQSVTTTQK